MFWKKDKSPVFVELNTDNARHAYRVTPSQHTPIALLVGGERGRILNISTVGIAFVLEDACDPVLATGQRVRAALILGGPKRHHPIAVELEIIEQRGNHFRGRLTPTSARAQKDLCHYVVTHQKQEIRRLGSEPGDHDEGI